MGGWIARTCRPGLRIAPARGECGGIWEAGRAGMTQLVSPPGALGVSTVRGVCAALPPPNVRVHPSPTHEQQLSSSCVAEHRHEARAHTPPGVPGLSHVILTESRQALISYQDYHMLRAHTPPGDTWQVLRQAAPVHEGGRGPHRRLLALRHPRLLPGTSPPPAPSSLASPPEMRRPG